MYDPSEPELPRRGRASRAPDWQSSPPPPPSTALRVVIGSTLAVGAVLVGILVLRETVAPAWLMPSRSPSPSASAGPSPPPPLAAPSPPPVLPPGKWSWETPSATVAAASPSGSAATPAASASARAPAPTWNGGAAPGDPEVVELPEDFQYHPPQQGNLTLPAPSPSQ